MIVTRFSERSWSPKTSSQSEHAKTSSREPPPGCVTVTPGSILIGPRAGTPGRASPADVDQSDSGGGYFYPGGCVLPLALSGANEAPGKRKKKPYTEPQIHFFVINIKICLCKAVFNTVRTWFCLFGSVVWHDFFWTYETRTCKVQKQVHFKALAILFPTY